MSVNLSTFMFIIQSAALVLCVRLLAVAYANRKGRKKNENGRTSYEQSQLMPLKAILFFKKNTKYNLNFVIVSDHM